MIENQKVIEFSLIEIITIQVNGKIIFQIDSESSNEMVSIINDILEIENQIDTEFIVMKTIAIPENG